MTNYEDNNCLHEFNCLTELEYKDYWFYRYECNICKQLRLEYQEKSNNEVSEIVILGYDINNKDKDNYIDEHIRQTLNDRYNNSAEF